MILDISFSTAPTGASSSLEAMIRSADGGAVAMSPSRWLVDSSDDAETWIDSLVRAGAESVFVSTLVRGSFAWRLGPAITDWLRADHRRWSA